MRRSCPEPVSYMNISSNPSTNKQPMNGSNQRENQICTTCRRLPSTSHWGLPQDGCQQKDRTLSITTPRAKWSQPLESDRPLPKLIAKDLKKFGFRPLPSTLCFAPVSALPVPCGAVRCCAVLCCAVFRFDVSAVFHFDVFGLYFTLKCLCCAVFHFDALVLCFTLKCLRCAVPPCPVLRCPRTPFRHALESVTVCRYVFHTYAHDVCTTP